MQTSPRYARRGEVQALPQWRIRGHPSSSASPRSRRPPVPHPLPSGPPHRIYTLSTPLPPQAPLAAA
ncbi:unnamed protein product [Spirodela intermedia]|uniref:Uncharacterized protein n=1 Tax=Spirodela intermedia TaxID=51605 RepID=A0ABN7EBI2_SPIIN|nr:unnamed protein product [Spirodela intermedia]